MKILIIGCGWLGFPLAKVLLSKGYQIYGSTRDHSKLEELSALGIKAFIYNENDLIDGKIAENTDVLIITVPPGKTHNYSEFISHLIRQFPSNTKIIFTSSISVYDNEAKLVNENSTVLSENTIVQAENTIREYTDQYIILRLAGLIGENRHPINHMIGKEVKNPNYAVNLVHQNDVINVILHLIQFNQWKLLFNICYPFHPTKKVFYSEIARQRFMEPLNFEDNNSSGKVIDGSLIEKTTNFKYAFNLTREIFV